MNTEEAFNQIMNSSLFTLSGEDIDLSEALCALCEAILEEEETNWELGEGLDCSLDALIVGSYWACQGWIADSCFGGSTANAPYFKLECIFSPGMSQGPEEDSSEQYAFEVVDTYFSNTLGREVSA